MATNNISSMINSRTRMTGLASGLDVDSLVKQMVKADSAKIDKVKQERQILEWKKDSYRDVTKSIKAFKDSYLDVLSATNMRSDKQYKTFAATASAKLTADAGAVTVNPTVDAMPGNHTISVVDLATAEVKSSAGSITKGISGDGNYTINAGETFTINLDGVSKTVTITGNTLAQLNDDIKAAVGANKVIAADDGTGKLTLSAVAGSGVNAITVSAGTTGNALPALGFGANAVLTNRLSMSDTLEALQKELSNGAALTFGALTDPTKTGIKLTINGQNFEFSKDTSLGSMISQINSNSKANVNMQYDVINDKFVFTAKQTGAGENINISDATGTFLAAADVTNTQAGTDATVKIDGQTITRSSNTFNLYGINFTAVRKTTGANDDITVNTTLDVNKVYDNIKTFVDKYNELVSKLNSTVSEKRNKDYQPLTDDQKSSMKDEDIKSWEEKAKSGMLNNDSMLNTMLTDMRKAIYEKVSGVASNISSIGITTGDFRDNGKLIIDETKLKDAITNSPDTVLELFTKDSDISYEDSLDDYGKKTQRQKETGIANRLFDIVQDAIRTTRDSKGHKGRLIDKAGIAGDITEFTNLISGDIEDKDDTISSLLTKLSNKEDMYYRKFTALETAMQKMNSQSSWLSQQLGGSQ